MNGKALIEQVRRSIEEEGSAAPTDRAVAEHLGISITGLANWRSRETITPRQMVGLLTSVAKASKRRINSKAIRPVVEFFHIQRFMVGHGEDIASLMLARVLKSILTSPA